MNKHEFERRIKNTTGYSESKDKDEFLNGALAAFCVVEARILPVYNSRYQQVCTDRDRHINFYQNAIKQLETIGKILKPYIIED